MLRIVLAAALIGAVAAPAAAAGSFYDTYIKRPGGLSPCYARTYGADHLVDHPRQVVTRFYVTRSEYDEAGSARAFDVAFGFTLRTMGGAFVGYASCRAKGDGAACVVEADGGGFTLSPRPDGLLVSVDGRLEIEGSLGFSPNLHDSDDREFRLYADDQEACFLDDPGGADTGNSGHVLEPLTPTIKR
ncbi:MAG: hypothetical protein J0H08_14920 [Rhizobiales bacterium]|nr:hypothetical protein [Hyphomicrobiales bacterium]